MDNRKIKAFLLIACIINLTITNCIPVYATVPGVVEAESIWLTLETIALNMGVTLEFMPDKSISYNNEQKRQEMIDYIDKELTDGVISQSQHDAAIANLDNLTGVNGSHVGVGDAINLGADLWSSLCRFFYQNNIKTEVNFYNEFTTYGKAVIDEYSGKCAIYGVLSPAANGYPASRKYMFIMSDHVLQSPTKFGSYRPDLDAQSWYITSGSGQFSFVFNDSENVSYGSDPYFAWMSGENIFVQYWDYKPANLDFPDTNNENALTSAGTYQDYLDKLADIYELLDGKIVVKDTGEAPTVLDGDTIADTVSDIQDGVTTWENAIPAIQAAEGDTTGDITGENSVIGKKALDELVTGLNVSQIQNKFPFCIPSDIKEIASGAASVSGNAPVITIPLKLEFAGTTYYEDAEAVTIDFQDFSQLALIFRKGFLLLFLVGMIYLSIYVISSFFHVTE